MARKWLILSTICYRLSASPGLFSAWLTRLPQPVFGYSLLVLNYGLSELTLAIIVALKRVDVKPKTLAIPGASVVVHPLQKFRGMAG